MRKRKPLLVDRFLASLATEDFRVVNHHVVKNVAKLLRSAKRFVLDDDASRYVGEMIKMAPQAIADAQEFALSPFELMYIELDPRPLFRAINDQEADRDADGLVGFLFDFGRVYTLSGLSQLHGSTRDRPAILPMSYRLHKPMSFDEEQEFTEAMGISRLRIDQHFWGSTYNHIDDVARRALRANNSVRLEFNREIMTNERLKGIADLMLHHSAGDLRTIIALLLLLNRTSDTRVERFVPAAPALIRRKPSAMVSHTVISFKLNPVPKLIEVMSSGGVWRRRHDVKGHFCISRRARESFCITHDWSEFRPNQWRCMNCSGLKWWRKEHKRGHEDKGITKTTYEVHA